jgi:hypothetical protein
MIKFELYFQKSLSWLFFVKLIFFLFKMYVKEFSRWVAFPIITNLPPPYIYAFTYLKNVFKVKC